MYNYFCVILYGILLIYFIIRCHKNSFIFYVGLIMIVVQLFMTIIMSLQSHIIIDLESYESMLLIMNIARFIRDIIFVATIIYIFVKDWNISKKINQTTQGC